LAARELGDRIHHLAAPITTLASKDILESVLKELESGPRERRRTLGRDLQIV
jgi:hypothetical protein